MFSVFTYLQAKSVSDEFIYDEYRQKKIREKISEQIASRVKTKVLFVYFCTLVFFLSLCVFSFLYLFILYFCTLTSVYPRSSVSEQVEERTWLWTSWPRFMRKKWLLNGSSSGNGSGSSYIPWHQEMHSSSLQRLPRPPAKNELIMALCMCIRVYVSLLFCGIFGKSSSGSICYTAAYANNGNSLT